jgi:hypothetical protein
MRFVDTNILLYAVSTARDEHGKAEIARTLLEADDLALSRQGLQEFLCPGYPPGKAGPPHGPTGNLPRRGLPSFPGSRNNGSAATGSLGGCTTVPGLFLGCGHHRGGQNSRMLHGPVRRSKRSPELRRRRGSQSISEKPEYVSGAVQLRTAAAIRRSAGSASPAATGSALGRPKPKYSFRNSG